MPLDRRAIKAAARERLRSAEPRPLLEGLIFVLIAGAMIALSVRILSFRLTPEASEKYFSLFMSGAYEKALAYLDTLRPSGTDYLISSVLQAFRGIVAVGFSIFALKTLRRDEASLWNLLDAFARFFPFLLLVVLRGLLVTIWAQLFVIPGILAFYRYRMAVYLMIDHPELGAVQALALSGRLMRGNKWSLFQLDLSFVGWSLLASLPMLLGAAFPGWLMPVLGTAGSAAILAWLLPYYELSCAGFYEAIRPSLPQIFSE